MASPSSLTASGAHKLLVANRGEIAVRILHTAKRLGVRTVAVYTPADATAPHVVLADEAYPLLTGDSDDQANVRGYIDSGLIVSICKEHAVTLVHPGYGFLSENSKFAQMVEDAGVTWLGPRPETIEAMGLKHRARELAREVDVPVIPGSEGLLGNVEEAVAFAVGAGFPVMLKSTAGGGGMGLAVCNDVEELHDKLQSTQAGAQRLFDNDGLFIERYYPTARHIEVQIFGDGRGHAIHMGERECSIQRRHQKVIEESPSPFMLRHSDVRVSMCAAAVRLAEHVGYESAGTVEFLIDDTTGGVFFLEMNTRLQVEHTVTEQIHPGLDIVELMILQGIAKRDSLNGGVFSHPFYSQKLYTVPSSDRRLHAIEVRVYCENPSAQFKPCPGILQQVDIPAADWLRVESWIETGTIITPYYDPLACKIVVTGSNREEAIVHLTEALSKTKIYGPPNNIRYLQAICSSDAFQAGDTRTTFLETFSYIPRAFTVLGGGIETTVQDYPGRRIGHGLPRSGPMDSLAFRIANVLVGNDPGTEGLELTLTGCRLVFHAATVVAVTGAAAKVTVDETEARMWERFVVPAGSKLTVGTMKDTGMRMYLAVRGGFPEIPNYLGSKSTSMGLGGYQGRPLAAGDHIALGDCEPSPESPFLSLPDAYVPTYVSDWVIHVLPGPQCDPTFITPQGIADFFSTKWIVSMSSNRMGIRLEGPHITWARENGGEGGSHPSNILDNGYAFGTINVNGDTPVVLTHEGPDMGGYVCVCTIASAELWKLGQLRAGDTVRFLCVSYDRAITLYRVQEQSLANFAKFATIIPTTCISEALEDACVDPRLHVVPPNPLIKRPDVVFRQAGDSAVLVEFGDMQLDFAIRARIHAFETNIKDLDFAGVWSLAPCIRSIMVHFDPLVVTRGDLLTALIHAEAHIPSTVDSLTFPGRRITFPIVLNDRWSCEALERYMRSIRATAAYLPSNIEYLARNNGLQSGEEVLRLLVRTDFMVFGIGFYLACPFLVPIDPRCRLVGQKMNPSRTYTPRGAVGIAGVVAAIYPIESPGGYQLYGRTVPPWQAWGKGSDFSLDRPWLLQPFDQVAYETVSEHDYVEIEKRFESGQYVFKIEDCTFSMADYTAFVTATASEVTNFKTGQAQGVASEEIREHELFFEWDRQCHGELEAHQTKLFDLLDHRLDNQSHCVNSPLTAHISKIKCAVGDTLKSPADVLLVLEAMKTEITVDAGEQNVGRKVKGFGRNAREGATVQQGDVLVVME